MNNTPSRAFAVLKPSSVQYRLNIETEIVEAGFEIVKARQIHFNPEDESLEEVFGRDANSLKAGPAWVYVLDKANAIQDLLNLVGDDDPSVARQNAPNSLRAKFGGSLDENVMFVGPDRDSVELLISAIFQSSPPFPPIAFPGEDEDFPKPSDFSLDEKMHSLVLADSSNGNQSRSAERTGKAGHFKARAVPPTNTAPTIQPRTTKAAALRAGLILPSSSPSKARTPLSKEKLAKTFANVPGHKRAETIAVASTAPPAIAPRASRASLLRQGVDVPKKSRSRPSTASAATTSNTPGYKRQLNIQVASTAPPAIQPRPTRASALRTGQPVSPPKKVPRPSGAADTIFDGIPGHKRRESIPVASTRPPATAPRLNRSATLRARRSISVLGPPSSFSLKENVLGNSTLQEPLTVSGALSTQSTHSSFSLLINTASLPPPAPSRGRTSTRVPPSSYIAPRAHSTSPPPTASRSSSVPRPASISRPPSIEPKTNRSAMLRARKMGIPTPEVIVV